MGVKGLHGMALYGALAVCIVVVGAIVAFMPSAWSTKNILPSVIEVLHGIGVTPPEPVQKLFQYVEVVDGCDHAFVGECVNVRSGPGELYDIVLHLRTGIVLSITDTVTANGRDWYKINFVHPLLYPERVKGDWYVAAEFVKKLDDVGDQVLTKDTATTTKHIIVDISEEMLYAYDGDQLFMKEPISTGLEFTPTPRGTFQIFKKTPSRFMQGPIPGVSEQVYDLPGVPWNLYFTSGGAVIHGAYWHDHFGVPWSHGCVNLPPQKAKELYDWADVGTSVMVRN